MCAELVEALTGPLRQAQGTCWRLCCVDGLSMCASDDGGESGGPAVRVQLALRTMTGGPFRRLQELAAVLRGWFVNVCERRRRRIWRAGCQSAIGPAHYDRRSVSPTAGARGCAAWMVCQCVRATKEANLGGRLSECNWPCAL